MLLTGAVTHKLVCLMCLDPAVPGCEGAEDAVLALPQEVHDVRPTARGTQGRTRWPLLRSCQRVAVISLVSCAVQVMTDEYEQETYISVDNELG
jgi:hypothetical protein